MWLLLHLRDNPRHGLIAGIFATVFIALIDWKLGDDASLGFLYMFPMLLAGPALPYWLTPLAAILCTVLADLFYPFGYNLRSELQSDFSEFLGLAGTGMFARALSLGYLRETQNLARAEAEAARRLEAEQQLQFLIETSSAAILTMNQDGQILLANPAAHRLFGVDAPGLLDQPIARYLPALGSVRPSAGTSREFRTQMQCRGQRSTGEYFLTDTFFSTYNTASGLRLAAMVVDASEHLRDREESSLDQLLAGSRILMAAVSHEIRNVCGAIRVVHENLLRSGTLSRNADFEALGSLIETLNRIASLELQNSVDAASHAVSVEVADVLADLRIVLDPSCREAEIDVEWNVPATLPAVYADRHRLMQVLLNLTRNSQRALEDVRIKRIAIAGETRNSHVEIRVTDSGPGIADTTHIFQPLQKGAKETGLGLYLSRAFLRSFGGDLRHEPSQNGASNSLLENTSKDGCTFVIELPLS